MKKELVISSRQQDVEIALLEESKLVEIHRQKSNASFNVGDIYLGRVKKLMPGLNAAFIDIGHRKDAFLHYTDLGPKLPCLLRYTRMSVNGGQGPSLDDFDISTEIVKNGKIDKVLKKREFILVQILKEPISTKGPRLSCEITIPGRYLVLTPFSNVVAVSKKLSSNEERKRLEVLISSIKPKNFGVIVRTAAEGRKVAVLHEELNNLREKWRNIHDQLKGAVPPLKLLSEENLTSTMLRDIVTEDFSNIVVDEKILFSDIRDYLKSEMPQKEKIVRLHKGNRPIFDELGVTRQIKSSFGKTSTMSSGAYVVIESTEAMHVIDVNSGPKLNVQNQEQAVLNVNLEAAKEISRQLRLRDIGGLIVIDFIDMRNAEHRRMLVKQMRDFMREDRAQHTVLPLSKFGLMQITRQRVRPEVKINVTELCPTCNGTGKSYASILVMDDIQRDLEHLIKSGLVKKKVVIHLHPFVHSHLTKGLFMNERRRWSMKYGKQIKLIENQDFHINEYKFFDEREDEIRL